MLSVMLIFSASTFAQIKKPPPPPPPEMRNGKPWPPKAPPGQNLVKPVKPATPAVPPHLPISVIESTLPQKEQ